MGEGFYWIYDKENDMYSIIAIDAEGVRFFEESEIVPTDVFLNNNIYKLIKKIPFPKPNKNDA